MKTNMRANNTQSERAPTIKTVAARATRSLAALIAIAVVCMGLAGPSGAAPYGTVGPTVTVSTTHPGPGQGVTFTFTGAKPGDTIVIVIHSAPRTLGTYVADKNGYVAATVKVPYGFHGFHNIVGTDVQSTLSATARIRIGSLTTAATSPNTSLGDANVAAVGVGLLALVLLGGGGALVLVGTRRRRQEEQA